MMKRVVLVYPQFRYPSGDFSLGLAYVGAYLRAKVPDIQIDLIDTTYHQNLDYVKTRLNEIEPDVALIYMDTLMYEDGLKVAGLCKDRGIRVVIGGPHPTVLPETVISCDDVDAIIIGEGEVACKKYVEAFYGNEGFENIDNMWFKMDGEVIKNRVGSCVEDLDALPFPDIDLYDVEKYIQRFIQLDSYKSNIRGVSLIASRGCPFQCSYCQPTLTSIFGPKLRIRSPRNVVEEIKRLKRRYRLEAFYFQDDTLTIFHDWVNEFCELLINEHVGIVWACNTRADTCRREDLELMKRAGLRKLKIGIESVTDRIRNGIYNKKVSIEQINDLIGNAKSLGIQTAGFFMLGAPTETVEEVKKTINFAVKSDLVEANFSITTPLPKTALWNKAKELGWRLPEKFSEYDYYKAVRPSMSEGDVSREKLEKMRKWAIIKFYGHPKRSIKIFFSLFSITGMKRFVLKLKRF